MYRFIEFFFSRHLSLPLSRSRSLSLSHALFLSLSPTEDLPIGMRLCDQT